MSRPSAGSGRDLASASIAARVTRGIRFQASIRTVCCGRLHVPLDLAVDEKRSRPRERRPELQPLLRICFRVSLRRACTDVCRAYTRLVFAIS